MNTNHIVRIIHRLAAITIVASFALVPAAHAQANAQMETHNPYTVRGLQIRTNLIPEETTSAYSTMEVTASVGPTLFQEMVPCRFVSTLDHHQYPVRWGGQPFQVSERRVYHPIGYLVEGQFRNPCSELIPSDAVALSVRIAAYEPGGNGSVYLGPAAIPAYNRAALRFSQGNDAQQEANVVLEDKSFVVAVADQSTELTIDIIGFFIPDPLANAAKGDKGERGERGEMGPAGAKGDDGVAGAQGTKGDKGGDGVAGAQGTKGDKGDDGVAGAQGTKGDKGDNGVAGAKGEKGDKGDDGVAGAQGTKGDKGDDGVAGAKGEKGDKGDDGVAGAQGDKGDRGLQGERGFQGERGVQGFQGIQGAQGPKGDPGLAMFTGTSTFPPGGSITINNSNVKSNSVILLLYIEVSNGNALGVASQKSGSFVASGSPNKPFKYVILNMN
ncbi:MAG: collagen-like protein [Acidobacteriota bacterium]|nr:collagen-like protein [Acidobacteriota bacterium]